MSGSKLGPAGCNIDTSPDDLCCCRPTSLLSLCQEADWGALDHSEVSGLGAAAISMMRYRGLLTPCACQLAAHICTNSCSSSCHCPPCYNALMRLLQVTTSANTPRACMSLNTCKHPQHLKPQAFEFIINFCPSLIQTYAMEAICMSLAIYRHHHMQACTSAGRTICMHSHMQMSSMNA